MYYISLWNETLLKHILRSLKLRLTNLIAKFKCLVLIKITRKVTAKTTVTEL